MGAINKVQRSVVRNVLPTLVGQNEPHHVMMVNGCKNPLPSCQHRPASLRQVFHKTFLHYISHMRNIIQHSYVIQNILYYDTFYADGVTKKRPKSHFLSTFKQQIYITKKHITHIRQLSWHNKFYTDYLIQLILPLIFDIKSFTKHIVHMLVMKNILYKKLCVYINHFTQIITVFILILKLIKEKTISNNICTFTKQKYNC